MSLGLIYSVFSGAERQRSTIRTGALAIGFGLALLNSARTGSFVLHSYSEGAGYNSPVWRKSELVKAAKALDPTSVVYSNAPDALLYLAHLSAQRLPVKVDPMTGRTNPSFDEAIKKMAEQAESVPTFVVYFRSVTWRWYLPTPAISRGGLL